jgi:Fe-S-cluster-containing dehydrogenase component/DMSO reductase anchor subunit
MNFPGLQSSTPVLGSELALEAMPAHTDLIGSFLKEQGDLTAVERFAQFHEDAEEPLQGRYYSALMPTEPPGPGQQYAFEVDLDRCSGCKACVAACHNLNGLDEGESWREVGLVLGGRPGLPVLQHVTTACHHCLDPACLNVCPVDAYEKDPVTGIVQHLDDQCFGCQYCTLACPYDAPKFRPGKGIVRKCDMCSDRLAAGEAPACIQACPNEAIRIRIVDREGVIARAESNVFLPGASDPRYTLPTTTYRSGHLRESADVQPADDPHVEPEHAHWPLIIMLVLTQLWVGGFVVELAAVAVGATRDIGTVLHTALSLGLGYVGLLASVLHLGRPLFAYRALIGLRHSWLSREVLNFALFAGLATVFVALDVLRPQWLPMSTGLRAALLGSVVILGLAGLASSVMVYHVVRREFWRALYGGIKFAGTGVVLGLATAMVTTAITWAWRPDVPSAIAPYPLCATAIGLIAATSAKLAFEAWIVRGFARSERMTLRKTAILLTGTLRRPARLRQLLGLTGGVILPALAIAAAAWGNPRTSAAVAIVALAASIGAEIAERYLFFTAVVRPKMPGGLLPCRLPG